MVRGVNYTLDQLDIEAIPVWAQGRGRPCTLVASSGCFHGNQATRNPHNCDVSSRHHRYGVACRMFPRKHSYLMLIYKLNSCDPPKPLSLCQPTWMSILSCPPFDRGCLQWPLARYFMPLSASSITFTSIPFLTSPDLAVQHVQDGGSHTWNSVEGSVYLPCARSSIRNTVYYFLDSFPMQQP